MVRGRTEMRRIENPTSRQVTFSKRRNGLLKKAFELSVLCDAEVGLIVFSPRGKLYEFSSSSMPKTIERYRMNSKEVISNNKATEHDIQQWKQDTDLISKRIDVLQDSKRKLMGENLESCSVDELHELESQLEQSISKVRGRKNHLLEEQVVQLKERERVLLEENALLLKQGRHTTFSLWKEPQMCLNASKEVVVPQCDEYRDVETELYVGLAVGGRKRTQQFLKG
uniref:Forever young flower protein n=1 Tax=Oncidium hybrid cultivar TaxID=141207 RepID=E7E1S7_ONCHC|nr:forever young flower protein [Oncidium hybrid cultivar]